MSVKLRSNASDYIVRDGKDFAVVITARYVVAVGSAEFRVSKVFGDVTRLDRLKTAIRGLLADGGAPESTIVTVRL